MPRCDWQCMVPEVYRERLIQRVRKNGGVANPPTAAVINSMTTAVNRSRTCARCECMLCAICAKPVNRWLSPTGQEIETVTTRTEPRFTFAYNPYDDDMSRMHQTLIVEPTLTHAWHEATHRCCKQTGGVVVDIGGNFGWYTLYSLALGCSVMVFEPVPAYREVMQLGLALNPGFAARTTLFDNVVYDTPGNYTLRVPKARPGGRMKKLGMTGMDGSSGILKADWKAESYNHVASSVRIDDIFGLHGKPTGAAAAGRRLAGTYASIDTPVCMLKADVEGYEPQVLQTARRLLTRKRVPALQLELTRTPKQRNQTCAAIKALAHLAELGYDFRQVKNNIVDEPAPPVGQWALGRRPWAYLPSFPSPMTQQATERQNPMSMLTKGAASVRNLAMQSAYRRDFVSFSTNLVALHQGGKKSCGPQYNGRRCPPWPSLTC